MKKPNKVCNNFYGCAARGSDHILAEARLEFASFAFYMLQLGIIGPIMGPIIKRIIIKGFTNMAHNYHQLASDFDDFCTVGKRRFMAFQRCKNHQNPMRSEEVIWVNVVDPLKIIPSILGP